MVGMADGHPRAASERALLPNTSLRQEARQADLLPGLQHSLVSVGKLSDSGYVTIFDAWDKGVTVYDRNDVQLKVTGEAVLRGWRDEATGLWRIPLTANAGPENCDDSNSTFVQRRELQEAAHHIFELPSIERSIRYLHAALGFPTKATWLKAIRLGNFVGWPLVTVENVSAHYPETDETPKGHMNAQRQGVRSTKPKASADFETASDAKQARGKKEQDVYFKVYDMKHTIYSDQTGRFPVQSKSGNKYVMVMVEIDSNAILVEAMKSKSDAEMQRAYLVLVNRLKRAGVVIKKHVLDNECSKAMKLLIEETCKYELVPPGSHRRNIAEVAIKIFKQHFVSVLAGLPDSFPMYLWDKLLSQTELTLNLLRQSNATPTISAHAHLYGPFDFNRMPLAPLGCEVQVHEPPDKRGTWSQHSKKGWYLGTSDEHYRCYKIHVKETRAERISETVFFKHKYVSNPSLTHGDLVVKAAQDLARVLLHKSNAKGDDNLRGLKALSGMFSALAHSEPGTTWEQEFVPKPTRPVQAPRVAALPASPAYPRTPTPRPALVVPSPRTSPVASPRVATKPSTPLSIDTSCNFDAANDAPSTPSATPPSTPSTPRSPLQALQDRFDASATAPATPPTSQRNTNNMAAQARGAARELKSMELRPDEMNLPSRRGNRAAPARSEELANLLFALDSIQSRFLTPDFDFVVQPNKRVAISSTTRSRTELANNVLDEETGQMLSYRQLLQHPKYKDDWAISSANEFGRLAQGLKGRVKGTNTIFFIAKSQVPADRLKDVTYGKFVCKVRPEKKEPNRTRLTVGGNRVNYPFEVGTPTADMLLAKILFNSVVSTENARFMTIDISNFYLNTPMKRYEYVRLNIKDIPDEVIEEYKLRDIATPDGRV